MTIAWQLHEARRKHMPYLVQVKQSTRSGQ